MSLIVGVLASLVAVVVGTIYGSIAGYFGGRTDSAMMRLVDILHSIPYMFILILLLIIFGRSFIMLFVGIGLVSWLGMARVVRGQTLALKNREFVEAAVATGVKPLAIVFRHLLPNLLGIVAMVWPISTAIALDTLETGEFKPDAYEEGMRSNLLVLEKTLK